MCAKGIDHLASTLNEVEHAIGKSGFHEQLGETHRGERNFFAGFQDEGISTGDGQREHPHRNHGRKVEWRNACANTDRLTHGDGVDLIGHLRQALALGKVRNPARKFHHFDTTAHIALRLIECFSILACHKAGEFLKVGFQKIAVAEKERRALG